MTAMPDPGRTVERSAAIFRRFGANRRQSYEAVLDIAFDLISDMHESGQRNYGWLIEVWRYAHLRFSDSPADDPARAAPEPNASESSDTARRPL